MYDEVFERLRRSGYELYCRGNRTEDAVQNEEVAKIIETLLLENEVMRLQTLTQMYNVEKGAAIAHEQWSGWMQFMFSKCEMNEDGTATIPAWAVQRWMKQMQSGYNDLPEAEKDSDRTEASKYMAWLSTEGSDLLHSVFTSIVNVVSDLRNELCIKCGRYFRAHVGECNGCRWRKG